MKDELRIRRQHERIRALLDAMDVEFGPVPPEELERARILWRDVRLAKRRRQGPVEASRQGDA